MAELPRVTAVVVAYNGGDDLRECIESLLRQTLADLEIIVVDNASTDGSVDALDARLSGRIRVIRRRSNGGYAAGANAGWRAATTELVAILNQDLVLMPDCLEQMRDALVASPTQALVTPKLVLKSDPTRVNAIGNDVHLSGVAWCHGLGTRADEWDGVVEVTAISGAAFMARRMFLETLGGIEEAYFMYMEDVDLSLRTRIVGGTCIAACDAVAVHDWKPEVSPAKFERLERNRRAVWQRFFRRSARMYPLLVQAELMAWTYAVAHGAAYVRAKVRAGRRPSRPALTIPSSTNDLLALLARTHPYPMLFPNAPVIQALGRFADRLFAVSAPTARVARDQ